MTGGQREQAAAELEAASDALRAASTLLDAGLVRDAVSRLYYAIFHAARAALLARDRHAKTHSGQVTVFEATFEREPLLGQLLRLRIDADYGAAPLPKTGSELRELLDEAAVFVERCRGLVDVEIAKGVKDPDPPPDL